MKKIIAISLIGLCFMSCAYKSVKYTHYFSMKTSAQKKIYKKVSVRMRIPAGYQYRMGFATWEEIDYFNYPDSSVIYITNCDCFNPNYENAQYQYDTIYRFRFQRHVYNKAWYVENGFGHMVPEYNELQGVDSNGLCWRDILKEDIADRDVSFGYARVPEDKKELYDKVIESARYKEKYKTNLLFRHLFARKSYGYRRGRTRK